MLIPITLAFCVPQPSPIVQSAHTLHNSPAQLAPVAFTQAPTAPVPPVLVDRLIALTAIQQDLELFGAMTANQPTTYPIRLQEHARCAQPP
jgi:hypothetical protein